MGVSYFTDGRRIWCWGSYMFLMPSPCSVAKVPVSLPKSPLFFLAKFGTSTGPCPSVSPLIVGKADDWGMAESLCVSWFPLFDYGNHSLSYNLRPYWLSLEDSRARSTVWHMAQCSSFGKAILLQLAGSEHCFQANPMSLGLQHNRGVFTL